MAKIRVTVDLNEKLNDRLEKLTKQIGNSSKADTIRDALRILEFLAERNQQGYELFQKKDNQVEIIPLFLNRIELTENFKK